MQETGQEPCRVADLRVRMSHGRPEGECQRQNETVRIFPQCHPPETIMTTRSIVQNAPSDPTT